MPAFALKMELLRGVNLPFLLNKYCDIIYLSSNVLSLEKNRLIPNAQNEMSNCQKCDQSMYL